MDDEDDLLRKFIERLEQWPEDRPPSGEELRSLRREIPLSSEERDKLERLADNHVFRGRSAMGNGAMSQAAAEIGRAVQLRPRDTDTRVELAEVYLAKALARGYGRKDRHSAVQQAEIALGFDPNHIAALRFIKDYRRMNADFRTLKSRKYLIPFLLILLLSLGALFWQREWVIGIFNPATDTDVVTPVPLPTPTTGEKELATETGGMAGSGLTLDVNHALVGSRNDGSYVTIQGRLSSSEGTFGSLSLLLRGYDALGAPLFALPWSVRNQLAAPLAAGDTQALSVFRWLDVDHREVDRMVILPLDVERLSGILDDENNGALELVWIGTPPQGLALDGEIRSWSNNEAYDRQVVTIDMALTNSGAVPLAYLDGTLSLGSQWGSIPWTALDGNGPSMLPGERRTWRVTLPLPLEADLAERFLTLRLNSADTEF